MKFLCLHGAIGSDKNFSIQLGPLEEELARDHSASFFYINGPVQVVPPEGFQDYFGIGPHYRWFDDGGNAENTMTTRIRQLPLRENPEDVIRALRETASSEESTKVLQHFRDVLNYLYDILDKNPDIEGIIGYSEGSSMASSLVLDEARRRHETGRSRQLKCAIFFTGWPPILPDGSVVLCDETETRVDIPTLHVVGANDPYKHGSLALYNVCDGQAEVFDTGKGHTLPRAGAVLHELGDAVRHMISQTA